MKPPVLIGAGPVGTRVYYDVLDGKVIGERLRGKILGGGPACEVGLTSLRLAALPLGLVFGVAIRDGLPLHIRWDVGSATRERHDVIDHVARTAMRIARLRFKLVLRRCAAPGPSVGIP